MNAETQNKIQTALQLLATGAQVAGTVVPAAGVAAVVLKHGPGLVVQAYDALMALRPEGVTVEELREHLLRVESVPSPDALIDRRLNP